MITSSTVAYAQYMDEDYIPRKSPEYERSLRNEDTTWDDRGHNSEQRRNKESIYRRTPPPKKEEDPYSRQGICSDNDEIDGPHCK